MALKYLFVSIAALLAGSLVDYARADVGYVCDGNVVVMVKHADLERMKRENACVASHHGLTATTPTDGRPQQPAEARAVGGSMAATATSVNAARIDSPSQVPLLRGGTAADDTKSRIGQSASGNVRLINRAPTVVD